MTKEEFLLDTVKYYSRDTNRRCKKDRCYYSPNSADKEGISEGCAIGRHLSPELQRKLDSLEDSGVAYEHIFQLLPSSLQELGQEFLADVQCFHDADRFWNSKEDIKNQMINIVDKHNLNIEMFKEYVN